VAGDEVVVSLAFVHHCLQVATWSGLVVGAVLGLVVGRALWGPGRK